MDVLYYLYYNFNGERKMKNVWLPEDAEKIRCNKTVYRAGPKGYCAKISFQLEKKKEEKLISVPKNAEEIIINPSWVIQIFVD